LYRRVVKPVAAKESKGSHYKELFLAAIDGSTLDLQDTKENAEHFGHQSGGRGECAFSLLRFVALGEVGTRVLLAAIMAPYKTSEQVLAKKVIGTCRLSRSVFRTARGSPVFIQTTTRGGASAAEFPPVLSSAI